MVRLLERCPTLKEMLDSQSASTLGGDRIPLHSNIPAAYAEALYQTVLRANPAVVLEVGMAYGVSSLAILSALRDGNRHGRLITIDPVQSTAWKGCGQAALARAGLAERHELIEEYNYQALPRLLAAGLKVDFAYIDGRHHFDYALLDWWFIDKMLPVEGIVGFNDCGWPAIEKVIRFVLGHRKYVEIDVGLPVTMPGGRKLKLLRGLTLGLKKEWCLRVEDRYLKKAADWEPHGKFFAPF